MATPRSDTGSHPGSLPGGRAVRVLLVDDSSADRVRFGRALSNAGYDVEDAEDGTEAWARLQRRHFDVVVSDRQMPRTDGIELIRLVRGHPDTSRIPVIMVSAMDEPKDREFGLAAGAVEYIAKNDERAMPALLHSVELLTRAIGPSSQTRLFERALIVDGSRAARQLLARSLKSYCGSSMAVGSIAEARAQAGSDLGLVVLDTSVEGAMAWFEQLSASPSRPAFVIVTSRPSQEEETRASILGAIGYLPKPISFRDLAHSLVASFVTFTPAPPRATTRPIAEASIADPITGEPQFTCQVVNLSATGALLATAAPIALGSTLLMWLVLDRHAIPTHARVVRVQEPGWGVAAGCGVIFQYDSDENRRFVERFVAIHHELSLRPRVTAW
jgi:CheY-like chemotaxis protein